MMFLTDSFDLLCRCQATDKSIGMANLNKPEVVLLTAIVTSTWAGKMKA
jgi:hypothetical protein